MVFSSPCWLVGLDCVNDIQLLGHIVTTCTHTHSHMHIHTHARHTCTHARTHTHTHTRTRTHTHTQTCEEMFQNIDGNTDPNLTYSVEVRTLVTMLTVSLPQHSYHVCGLCTCILHSLVDTLIMCYSKGDLKVLILSLKLEDILSNSVKECQHPI